MAAGYEVLNDKGERAWWDGKKLTPLDANGMPVKAGGLAGPKLPEPDQKRLTELKEIADKSLYAATQAEQFTKLNRKQGTGGINGVGLPFFGTMGDLAATWDPELAQMKAITSRVAPNLRPPGSGSSSDRDTAMYVAGFPNIGAPGRANAENQVEWQAKANQDAARAAFLDRYATVHGTLQGADTAFGKYWAERGGKKFGAEAMRQRPAAKGGVFQGQHGTVREIP